MNRKKKKKKVGGGRGGGGGGKVVKKASPEHPGNTRPSREEGGLKGFSARAQEKNDGVGGSSFPLLPSFFFFSLRRPPFIYPATDLRAVDVQ